MKKLFSTIVVFALLLSENAYAEILRLSCIAEDKTMTMNVLVDMDEKTLGSVDGNVAKAEVNQNTIILEYTFNNDSIDALFTIDRNSGIYNAIWTAKKDKKKLYMNGECLKAKKKF